MTKIVISTVREAEAYVLQHRPFENVIFERPSGKPLAAWIRAGQMGELFTLRSIKSALCKKNVLAYDFYERKFQGDQYAQKESSCEAGNK
jgi:hypothetical protein